MASDVERKILENSQYRLSIMRQLLSSQKFSQALIVADTLMNQSAEHRVECIWVSVLAYEHLGDHSSARLYLEQYLALNPNNLNALQKYVSILRDAKEYSLALSWLEPHLASDFLPLFAEMAHLYLDMGNTDLAIMYANKTLVKDANNVKALLVLGSVFILLGVYAEALKPLQHAATLDIIDPQIHINLAVAYQGLNETQQQIACFENALLCEPAQLSIQEALADLYMQTQAYADAIRCYDNIIHLFQQVDHGLIQRKRARCFMAQSDYQQAIKILLPIVEMNAQCDELWALLAACFFADKQPDKAQKCMDQISNIRNYETLLAPYLA